MTRRTPMHLAVHDGGRRGVRAACGTGANLTTSAEGVECDACKQTPEYALRTASNEEKERVGQERLRAVRGY